MKNQKKVLRDKLLPLSPEVRAAFLDALSGLSLEEAVEQVDKLKEVYYHIKLSKHIKKDEKIGGVIERRDDWPDKITEQQKKEILDEKIKEAME